MKTYSNLDTAKDNLESYSQQVHDDCYIVRSGSGRDFVILTREEMLEFKSEYIEGYYRYYPKDKQATTIMKFLKKHNLTGLILTIEGESLLVGDECKLVIIKNEKQF